MTSKYTPARWTRYDVEQLATAGVQPVWCTWKGEEKGWTPVGGTTGKDAPFGTLPKRPPANGTFRLAIRPPLGAFIMDVDQHEDGKDGVATLAAMERDLGPLPKTWRLTARGPDQRTGRYLFRIPEGLVISARPFEQYGGGIDAVRTGWRFSWAMGDIHPKLRKPVVLYDAEGKKEMLLPIVKRWPELPARWIEYFRSFEQSRGQAEAVPAADLPDPIPPDVQAELDRPDDERDRNAEGTGPALHKAVYSLVARCFDSDLTQAEAGAIAEQLFPLADAFAAQRRTTVAEEVARVWGQLDAGPEPAFITENRKPTKLEMAGVHARWLNRARRLGLIDEIPVAAPTGETGGGAEQGEQQQQGAEQGEQQQGAEIVPAPDAPLAVARIIEHGYRLGDHLVLRRWRNGWMYWRGTHWAEVDPSEVAAAIYGRLEHARYWKTVRGVPLLERWEPTRRKVGDVLDALGAVTLLSNEVDPPAWSDGREGVIVACENGLLNVESGELVPHTPAFFNLVSVDLAYDQDAPEPVEWLAFLRTLWPDDSESIDLLQEWMGYVLSGKTDQQKIALLIGPARSGKGTIIRILKALIGHGNYCGPTLSSLATNFGLQPLIGKPLAVVADARLGPKVDLATIVERLLSISGEDALTIDRKYREQWTGALPTRLMIVSNEIPHFADASGALASRFVILTMRESWLGREDTALYGRLLRELPGILRWALDGLARLTERGSFTEPKSSAEAVQELADSASPVSAFVRDRCEVNDAYAVPKSQLYAAWQGWCREHGYDHPGSMETFGRQLRSTLPKLNVDRPAAGKGSRERRYVGIRLAVHVGPWTETSLFQSDVPYSIWSKEQDIEKRMSRSMDQPGPASHTTYCPTVLLGAPVCSCGGGS